MCGRVLSQSNVRRVQADVSTEELADGNTSRTLIHGLSFRAVLDADCVETGTLRFLTLREKGAPEKEIAATFFVPVSMVKQRLKLTLVRPRLLDIYADDGMTLWPS